MEISKKMIAAGSADPQKNYELSVLIDADSFFYALFTDTELIQSDQLSIEEFHENQWLQNLPVSIRKGKIGVINPCFTIIPAADYDAADISKVVHSAVGHIMIHDPLFRSDYIPDLNAYLCYSLSASLLGRCRELFPELALCHVLTALISEVGSAPALDLIHFCKAGRQTVMIVKNENGIQFANTLDVDQPMGILYFATLVVRRLNLNLTDLKIELSGEFAPNSEVASLLRMYYPNVTYRNPKMIFEGQPMPISSLYFPIRSIALCA